MLSGGIEVKAVGSGKKRGDKDEGGKNGGFREDSSEE